MFAGDVGGIWRASGFWVMSEGSCLLSGGESLKRNGERSVNVALSSCRLVSQCLTIPTVWPGVWGRGVSVVSGRCLRDPVSCQGVIVSKQDRKGQLALPCSESSL